MSKVSRITSLLLTVVMLLSLCPLQIPVSAAEQCTIYFDGNGGVGVPATITVDAGTIITLPASDPKNPGMVFRGWAFTKEQADTGVITYPAGTQPQILVNNGATLFASWAYQVTLTPGTQGWGSTQTLWKFPAVDLQLFHHKNDIQPNYGMLPGVAGDLGRLDVFVEWNTNQLPNGKGNGTAYHEAYTANAPATLYAVWGNPIIYNADGGTFPMSGSDLQEEFVVGHSATVNDSTKFGFFNMPRLENTAVKPGCRPVTDANGETVYARVFTNGTVYRLENHDSWLEIPIFNNNGYSWDAFYTRQTSYNECALELYSVWEPSVTYKANGGAGADVVEYMTYTGPTLYSYADYTVLENGFTADSAFLGWNTMPDGTGTSYAAGDVINDYGASEPLVLYAQWATTSAHDEEYTVSFNAMEGYLPFDKQSYDIAYGEAYKDAFELPIPSRAGYIFKGWYNEETKSDLIYNTEVYSLDHDTSFTAKWELHGHHVLDCFKVEATCTNEGHYTTTCKGCGFYDTIVYEKIPHSFGSWTPTEAAGVSKRVCSACLAEETTDGQLATVDQQIVAYINRSVMSTDADMAYIDVLNYFNAYIDGGPGEYPFAESYFAESGFIRQRAAAKNPNVKVVLTICNRNIVKFENWLKTPALRSEFADHLVGVVFANNFDGLDIDFEFPQDLSLRTNYAQLLGEIRARFNARSSMNGRKYILSIATPASFWANEKFDLVACSQYLDFFNIMNYDLYCGTAVPYTHHHTPPYDNIDPYGHVPTGGSVQGDINLYKSLGIPADKIVSGMGLYSREWVGVANRNNGLFQGGGLQASNYHYDLLVASYINRNGYVRYWDDTSKAPYLYNASQGIFLSYEDPESIRYKCEIVARERVRGVMVFDYVTCDGAGIFGYIKSQIGKVLHSCNFATIETQALSCDENGHESFYCSLCGALSKHREIYREGHYCEEWEVGVAPTETKAGYYVGTCLFCGGELKKEIPATGYTVTFDGAGGSVKASTKYLVGAGESYLDALGGMPAAEYEGYSFKGWYDPVSGYTLNMADSFTLNANTTFVAQWQAGDIDDDHEHSYTAVKVKDATCTDAGIIRYTCSCGSSYTETVPALGHSFGDWTVTSKPTATTEGAKQRVCTVCGETEIEVIPATGYVDPAEITANEMTVTVTNAQNVDTLMYAQGRHLTVESIEAAGATTIADVAAKADNGVFTVDLTEEGTYTFAAKMIDGRIFYYAVEVKKADEPIEGDITAVANGAVVTISGLDAEVKDVFLAKGEYDNYSDVNTNKIVRLTQNKLKCAKSYDYTVPAGGVYTVLVRYNDGTMKYAYVEVNVVEPTMSADGLQITVKNLEGIKVIRTAYGEYKTGAQIKAAEGSRAFTAKGVLKGVDEYTIQYRNNGRATIAVCYENGYMKIFVVDIEQKVPTMVQNDNVVTFGNLDDLKVVRYAKGEYTTSSQIKAAPGSVALKPEKVVNGLLSVELKSAGTYTFCVQYNDESYNYYTVVVD